MNNFIIEEIILPPQHYFTLCKPKCQHIMRKYADFVNHKTQNAEDRQIKYFMLNYYCK